MRNFKVNTSITTLSDSVLMNIIFNALRDNEYYHTVYNEETTVMFDKTCFGERYTTVLDYDGEVIASAYVDEYDQ